MSEQNRDTPQTRLHKNLSIYPPQIVCLNLTGQNQSLTLAEGQTAILGRADKAAHFAPDFDFSDHDARKKGVSRDHARLTMREGAIYVMDMNSNNGTFVNGKKLPPQRPTLLKDGDHLRLALLETQITIQPASAPAS